MTQPAAARRSTSETPSHVHPTPQNRMATESEALLAASSAAVVAGLAALVIFFGRTPPLWGGVSLGLISAGAILVLGMAAAYIGYWRSRYLPDQHWRLGLPPWKFIVDASTVALVHALIAAIATVASFLLLQRSFQGLTVDIYAATVGMAVASGLAVYWIYLSVADISTRKLSGLLVLFMVMSIVASMATSQDPKWWEYHFSQLGTLGGASSGLFNLSLIVAGFFITTFAVYLDRDLKSLIARGVLVHRWSAGLCSGAFVAMGLLLAGVGVVPLSVSFLIHTLFASGMAVVFILLLLASPFILRGLPGRFFLVCGGFLAALIVSLVLFFPVGYFNLTAFELVAFVIIYGWIAVFIRLLDALATGSN
ncbi:DUF998 domain-containing protein [Arthrobacter sp. StoSoilB22]|uniref:DUF998 domain-containing protein n=1 Tax=Arthrobacter sp. StoSoilB22 TaxID=2830996 RepID=UPI001CC3FA2E|nr:DUF998 domain-containing protein [Arthrobacter sp. StoSoilB22]BCW64987.1 transcriptional regulator [Arthrobacter sp. StoSoilB22]